MAIFGYARVSTLEQNLDLQIDALLKYGIDKNHIYVDQVSASKSSRPKLDELMKYLREGDVLVVWKLDRFARSLIDFTKKIGELQQKGVAFKSLTEPFVDSSDENPQQKFFTNIMAVMAQFERDLIIERTKAGLESAKKRGVALGRKKGLSKEAERKANMCVYFYKENLLPVDEICKEVGVSKATYYKYLRHKGIEI